MIREMTGNRSFSNSFNLYNREENNGYEKESESKKTREEKSREEKRQEEVSSLSILA